MKEFLKHLWIKIYCGNIIFDDWEWIAGDNFRMIWDGVPTGNTIQVCLNCGKVYDSLTPSIDSEKRQEEINKQRKIKAKQMYKEYKLNQILKERNN